MLDIKVVLSPKTKGINIKLTLFKYFESTENPSFEFIKKIIPNLSSDLYKHYKWRWRKQKGLVNTKKETISKKVFSLLDENSEISYANAKKTIPNLNKNTFHFAKRRWRELRGTSKKPSIAKKIRDMLDKDPETSYKTILKSIPNLNRTYFYSVRSSWREQNNIVSPMIVKSKKLKPIREKVHKLLAWNPNIKYSKAKTYIDGLDRDQFRAMRNQWRINNGIPTPKKEYLHRKIASGRVNETTKIAKSIKNQFKKYDIDLNLLSSGDACKMLSCDANVEKIRDLAKEHKIDVELTIQNLRKIEKIIHDKFKFTKASTKIACAIYLSHDCYSQKYICESIVPSTSPASVRNWLKICGLEKQKIIYKSQTEKKVIDYLNKCGKEGVNFENLVKIVGLEPKRLMKKLENMANKGLIYLIPEEVISENV